MSSWCHFHNRRLFDVNSTIFLSTRGLRRPLKFSDCHFWSRIKLCTYLLKRPSGGQFSLVGWRGVSGSFTRWRNSRARFGDPFDSLMSEKIQIFRYVEDRPHPFWHLKVNIFSRCSLRLLGFVTCIIGTSSFKDESVVIVKL